MGINGAHALTYSVKSITIQQLFSIGLFLHNKYNNGMKRPPTIYVDASWMIRQCSIESCRIGYLVRLCHVLANAGFCITIVCDGAERHHSKRATTKRLAESYSSKIRLNRSNTFLMSLLDKKNGIDSLEEGTQIEMAISLVASKVATLQAAVKKAKIDVGTACFFKIQEEISKIENIGDRITVVQAEYQADSILAGAIENRTADMVLSADSDMAVLLGEKCFSIKKFVLMTDPRLKH
jgi:hypothetical protein